MDKASEPEKAECCHPTFVVNLSDQEHATFGQFYCRTQLIGLFQRPNPEFYKELTYDQVLLMVPVAFQDPFVLLIIGCQITHDCVINLGR